MSASPRIGRIIFFSLLALLPMVAVPYAANDPWWSALAQCAAFAFAALWFIDGFNGHAWFVSEHRLAIPLLALLAFALAQTLSFGAAQSGATDVQVAQTISADPFETRLWIFKMLAFVLFGALLLRYTSSPRRLRLLVHTVIGVGVACALFGIVRQTMQGGSESNGFLLWQRLVGGQGYAQFINRNHFAFLMEMTLGLLAGMIVGGAQRERTLIYLAAAAPVWTALVLSNSRGGILSMLAQLAFIALTFHMARPRRELSRSEANNWLDLMGRLSQSLIFRVVLIGCLLVAGAFSVLWVGGEQLGSRLQTEFTTTGNPAEAELSAQRQGATRQQIWSATWELIKAHPITGVGFGGYSAAIPEYHDASGALSLQQAHNDYIELLASGGIIGCALAMWFIIVLISAARRHMKSKDAFRRAVCFGALVGLFGVAVHSVFDFGLHTTLNGFVCVALIVIATANNRVEEAGERHDRTSRRRRSSSSSSSRRRAEGLKKAVSPDAHQLRT